MTSPDGKYKVVTGEYYEIRMGSPQFSQIQIQGSTFCTSGRSFGEAMAFSPDSRFLAIEELIHSVVDAPHTRAVVFDFAKQKEIIVHDQNPGFIKRFAWSGTDLLNITSWSHLAGEKEHTWHTPEIRESRLTAFENNLFSPMNDAPSRRRRSRRF